MQFISVISTQGEAIWLAEKQDVCIAGAQFAQRELLPIQPAAEGHHVEFASASILARISRS